MGQKVHPTGFRVGIMTEWASKWLVSPENYCATLHNDIIIRNYLLKKLAHASVSRVTIERTDKVVHIAVHTARPGIVIGKKGGDIEALRREVADISGLSLNHVQISIEEIRKPETDAILVASGIALQLERRIMYRRAMKRAVQNTIRLGALGIKVCISGRLNGVEIARSEWLQEGRIPLHTLDADIDYGLAEAKTTYGIIGVKVWIYKGNFSDRKKKEII